MMNPAQAVLPRIQVALGLFLITAIVTLPWAFGAWGFSMAGVAILAGWLVIAALGLPIARGRISGRVYWPMIAAALLLSRAPALWLALGTTASGDAGIYPELARSLLEGKGLVFVDPSLDVRFRALFPPLYPLFLAAMGSVFGLGNSAIWSSNVAVDAASIALIVQLGSRLGSAAAGRAAGWLFAIWPAFILGSPFAQKEGLVMLEVLVIALALVRLKPGQVAGWREAAMIGVGAGTLMLTQPGLALLPGFLGLALLPVLGWRPLLSLLARSAPIALLLLLPWWIRNYQELGAFVPLTTTAGLSLWIGNNPGATGAWMPMPEDYRGMPELRMSALAAQEAAEWIRTNPFDFILLSFSKLFRAFGLEQFALARLNQTSPAPSGALLGALFPVLQGSLIALLASTAALGRRLRARPGADQLVLLLCGCAAQILLMSLPFEFGERHRFFVMPFLFLLLAASLSREQAVAAPGGARG